MKIKSKPFGWSEIGMYIAGIDATSNGVFASWPAYVTTWKSTETDRGDPRGISSHTSHIQILCLTM